MIKLKRFTDLAFYDIFDWKKSLLLALGLVAVEWLFLRYGMNFQTLHLGDALAYWNYSLDWQQPYDSYHLPGYSFAIAGVRGVSGSFLAPSGIMLVTTLVAFSVSVVIVHQLAGLGRSVNRNTLGFIAVSIFVLWPLVGTNYVAYPIADMFGIAPFLLGLWFLVRKQSAYGGLFLGVALISHKAMWPFAGLLLLAHFLSMRSTRSLVAVGIAAIPLGVLWLLGTFHHDSVTWLISKNLSWEVASSSSLPILDGILGSIIYGGVSGIGKGLIILAMAAVVLTAMVRAWRLPNGHETKWYSLAILGAVLTMSLLLNEREIWASLRFGRLITVPLLWLYGDMLLASFPRWRAIGYVNAWAFMALVTSQFAFGYYMTNIWAASGIFPTER